MNILVMSDTHGFLPSDKDFFDLLDEVDRIYHLGDGWGEIRTLEYAYGSKLVYVGGNNDPVYGKVWLIDNADGTKILLTHGHTFGVRHDLYDLADFAREKGIRYVFYGHTHTQADDTIDGVRLINPGTFRHGNYCFASASDGKLMVRQMTRFV